MVTFTGRFLFELKKKEENKVSKTQRISIKKCHEDEHPWASYSIILTLSLKNSYSTQLTAWLQIQHLTPSGRSLCMSVSWHLLVQFHIRAKLHDIHQMFESVRAFYGKLIGMKWLPFMPNATNVARWTHSLENCFIIGIAIIYIWNNWISSCNRFVITL